MPAKVRLPAEERIQNPSLHSHSCIHSEEFSAEAETEPQSPSLLFNLDL